MVPAPTRATTKMPNNIGNGPFWFGYSLDFWNSVSSRLLVFAVVTGILAAVASGLSSWIGSAVTSQTQDAAGSRISAAELELQKSRERTAALDVAVADANARAAEANRTAEQERLARIKIEERLAELTAPRSIDANAVTRAARAFPGTKFDVSVFAPDPEAEGLAASIEAALTQAGWVVLSWASGSVAITRPNKSTWGVNTGVGAGVLVDSPQSNPPAAAVAAVIRQTLTIPGFAFTSSYGAPIVLGNRGALHFVIGKKPVRPE